MTDGGPAAPIDISGLGRVLVVIPTYNEAENLPLIVRRVRQTQLPLDILVVDDGSPDGSGAIADRLAEADPGLHVLHRSGKGGLGKAYVAGFDWGIAHGADVLVEMDADGSHAPEELASLLACLTAGADVALGSRWIPGGSVVNWPITRKALSRGGNYYVRHALGIPLRDATGGYRAYRRGVLRGIGYQGVTTQGYGFQIDLAWRALQSGFIVREVPITFVERQHGTSKMSGAIVAEALFAVTKWGVRQRLVRARVGARRLRDSKLRAS